MATYTFEVVDTDRVIARPIFFRERVRLVYTTQPEIDSDSDAPAVSFVGPPTIAPDGSIQLEVEDESDLSRLSVFVTFSDRTEVIFDGLTTYPGYIGEPETLPNGYSFTASRDEGWPEEEMTITVLVRDSVGNEGAPTERVYTIDPAPSIPMTDVTPPTVTNFSPAPGTTLAKTAAISFDVTDETGEFARIMVTVRFAETGGEELVHDGDAFAPFYARSSRVPIPGGLRYSVTRTGGWSSSPRIRVFPLDAAGNQP